MSKWQPIETAPRDGTELLLWYPDEDDPQESFIEVGWYNNDPEATKEYRGWLIISGIEATHWQPLPDPPKDV